MELLCSIWKQITYVCFNSVFHSVSASTSAMGLSFFAREKENLKLFHLDCQWEIWSPWWLRIGEPLLIFNADDLDCGCGWRSAMRNHQWLTLLYIFVYLEDADRIFSIKLFNHIGLVTIKLLLQWARSGSSSKFSFGCWVALELVIWVPCSLLHTKPHGRLWRFHLT